MLNSASGSSIEAPKGGVSPAGVSFAIKTFGCKVNTYDSGLLENRLAKFGYLINDKPQVHVLNTCAVTSEATQEALRTVRKLKRESPSCVVVVTGCGAQVDTDKFSNWPGVDLVVANSHKGQLESIIYNFLRGYDTQKTFKSNIFKKEDLEEGGGEKSTHTRTFLKIQDGCNSFCTFCVIPFARGKSRSLTIESLERRVKELVASGVKEVVLTGVHIGDYEFGLENLIERLLARTNVPRLRLTSLEPIELSDRLLELFKEPRLCPHFHMSIQSATTSVLLGMKRKYTALEVEKALTDISVRVPQAFVGMDVIAGFPGEGEDEFRETYERLDNLPWTRIHVFPYSPRPGTYALKLSGQNERSVIVRRADRLRELSGARLAKIAARQIGQTKKVLILNDGMGLSRDYWNVSVSGVPNHEVELSIREVSESSGGIVLK